MVRRTKRRIIDDGVGCDLICLAEPGGLRMSPRSRACPDVSVLTPIYAVLLDDSSACYREDGQLAYAKFLNVDSMALTASMLVLPLPATIRTMLSVHHYTIGCLLFAWLAKQSTSFSYVWPRLKTVFPFRSLHPGLHITPVFRWKDRTSPSRYGQCFC